MAGGASTPVNPPIDYFTVSLHSTNGRHLPAVRAVQGDCQWPLQNGGNFQQSPEGITCEEFRSLYLDQPITKLTKQAEEQYHKSNSAPIPYPTMHHSEHKYAHNHSQSCIAGYQTGALWDLVNLVFWRPCLIPHWQSYYHQVRTVQQSNPPIKVHLPVTSLRHPPLHHTKYRFIVLHGENGIIYLTRLGRKTLYSDCRKVGGLIYHNYYPHVCRKNYGNIKTIK